MAKASTCPNPNVLKKLATASLPPPEIEPLLQHLQDCEACLAQAQKVSTKDTLVDVLAKVQTLSGDRRTPSSPP